MVTRVAKAIQCSPKTMVVHVFLTTQNLQENPKNKKAKTIKNVRNIIKIKPPMRI